MLSYVYTYSIIIVSAVENKGSTASIISDAAGAAMIIMKYIDYEI